jgi:hypothetical protein
MSDATQVAGGCLCGAIRYEAEVYLDRAYYCHCRMCQKSTGSPAEIAVFVKPGTLRFTNEEPKYYHSSAFAQRGFCPHCGSRLIWVCPKRPEWTNLAVGCLDHPENVMPSEHIYVETQLPWYKIDDGLPRKRSDELPKLDAV